MQVFPYEVMARRIDRLEAQNRRQRHVGIAFALATVVFLVGGAVLKDPTTVVAEKILLVDKDRNLRIRIGTTDNGEPIIAFLDRKEKTGILLEHSEDGTASLSLCGRKGKERLTLGVDPDGSSYLTSYDHADKQRLSLQRNVGGSAGMYLNGDDGEARGSFLLDKDGSPVIAFYDKESNPRIGMRLYPNGNPTLGFFDKKESRRAFFGFAEDSGTATLSLKGQAAEGGVRVETREDGSSQLQVFDKDGKAQFQAPNP